MPKPDADALPTWHDLVTFLANHIGRENGIRVLPLACLLMCSERHVRRLVTEARVNGTAVCGHPNTGYFIASTADELEETCQFLRSRALRSLLLESRMRNLPLEDLVGQMRLRT